MDGTATMIEVDRALCQEVSLRACLIPMFFGSNDNSCSSEFEDSETLNCISVQLQQQLCEQTTTQLLGCESEESEFGMPSFSNIYTKMDMENLFSEESVKQSEFFLSEQWLPSSSSSSQRSLANSPEYSSLLKNMSFPIPDKVPYYGGARSIIATVRPYQSSIQASDQYRDIKFPTMKTEDMIITSAISAIFSSKSTAATTISDQQIREVLTYESLGTCGPGFKPYNSSIPPKFEPRKKLCGQKMIKDSIAYLRNINSMRDEATNQGLQPTRHQLHHMITERKRRKKLNESFYKLRLLLPPCSKKDKASVLYKTKDYLKTLEAQIFELEKNNQMLEMNIVPTGETKEDVSRSICNKNAQIVDAFETMIGIRRINFKITVRFECDLVELVLYALEYLKEIRAISLVSLDANTYLQQMVQFTRATLKFDIKTSDWDEISFKKGMTRAVDIATL